MGSKKNPVHAASYWVAVDGRAYQEGNFELVVQCSAGPTSAPTTQNTPYPTHQQCSYTTLLCGTSLRGDTHYSGNFGGGPAKEEHFLVAILDAPRRIVADTCNRYTNMNTTIWLYDGCPSSGGNPVKFHGKDAVSNGIGCGHLDVTVYRNAFYWLVIEGTTADSEGRFEVGLQCTNPPSPAPTAAPSPLPTPRPTISQKPTGIPTPRPTQVPTPRPSQRPSERPTSRPSPRPSPAPTVTMIPTSYPTTPGCVPVAPHPLRCGQTFVGNNYRSKNIILQRGNDAIIMVNISTKTMVRFASE